MGVQTFIHHSHPEKVGPFILRPRLDKKITIKEIRITNCARGSPNHPLFWGFSRRTHKTQNIVLLMAMIYYGQRIERKISNYKRRIEWSPEQTGHKLPRSPLQWDCTDTLNSSGKELWQLWQHLWNIVLQGRSLGTQCPRFLLGIGHTATFCMAHTKMSDS